MTDRSTFGKRYVAAADQHPEAYARYVKQVYGHPPADVERLLGMHTKLSYGGKLDKDDTAHLCRMHPDNRNIPGFVAELNRAHGPQRAAYFTALVTADPAGLEGQFNAVGDGFKHVAGVARQYAVEDISAAIQAKRDGGKVKPDRPERVEDPLSTRAIIEQQFEEPGQRGAIELINQGHERATELAREIAADKLERASATLHDDDKASLRDVVAAAYDSDHIEAVGIDMGWLPAKD